MFGGQSFGEFGYCEQEYTPLDTSEFEAFLADATAERCWLLELEALSLASVPTLSAAYSDAAFGEIGFSEGSGEVAGGTSTLRFSTHGYTSHVDDTPASTWYDGRLVDGGTIDRRLTSGNGISGLTTVFAEATLVNVDAALDTLQDSYALDGRRARLLVGRPDDPLSSFGLAFTGVVENITVGQQEMRIKLSDGAVKLDRPLNRTTYAGTGGMEGGDDLKGKSKPRCFGYAKGVTPPLVDTRTYQVNDGPISDVPQVYDRGILLTKVVGAPAPGEYQVNVTVGTFKLGVEPDGACTCNVLGDASLSGYINRTSDIVLRILVQDAGLTSSEVEPASFAQLNSDAPAEVGIWVGTDARSIKSVVGELLSNVGAFGGFTRQGGFSVGMVAAATGTPKDTFTEEDIIEITREPLPAAVDPIAWRITVGYQRNYTVLTDLAPTVPEAQKVFAAEALRKVIAEDASILSRYLLAKELAVEPGLFALEADADDETLRLFSLWAAKRKLLRVKTRPKALTRDMGQVIELDHPRHGLSGGRPGRVLGHMVRGSEVEMMVLV